MVSERARSSPLAALSRMGFSDPGRAMTLFADPLLAEVVDVGGSRFVEGLPKALSAAADPDLALLGLLRLLGAAVTRSDLGLTPAFLRADTLGRRRLIAVLGLSTAFGDQLSRHPEHWRVLTAPPPRLPTELRDDLLQAVGADPQAAVPVAGLSATPARDALRVAYRRRLLAVAGRDLDAHDPIEVVDRVSLELADLAAAALEAALAVARAETDGHGMGCRLAVIGMGKCGGRELNYVSDVDVIYVVEPAEGVAEADALAVGTHLAAQLAGVCSVSTGEGSLWPVDAALRPEGKDGPLVRTIDSHRSYYRRWAKTWEFQALLKARPVAGDVEVGRRYLEAISPFVWSAVERENFVADVQAMRRRVEAHVPAREAERQLKLGRGGLRDVEFSIQLLQLVHGRTEERLRTGNTLNGIEQLSTYGFIGRDAAAALDRAYRNLRVLEHRLQLTRLRRTHVLPTGAAEQRRLARSARLGDVTGLEELWRSTRAIVRPLHESLFYRPILAAAARLTADEARLTTQAAQDRLKALGYMNPAGAMKHLEALTDGVSRRAAIQRQLLPVLLGWFAAGADPDRGLLSFRKVSDALGTTHWYLQMLRDSGAAAERMAHVLSSGQYAGDLMVRLPESTRWLDDVDLLMPRSLPELRVQATATLNRHDSLDTGLEAVRLLRTREVLRTAIADIADVIEVEAVGAALSWATEAALDAALTACIDHVAAVQGIEVPTRIAIIAMGRLGGAELSYGSDADVMFVHDPLEGHDPRLAQDFAHLVCATLQKGLRVPSAQLPIVIDPTLRPEGRDGPLVRTLDSYARYYQRWSAGWESQALLRADPVGGDEQLGRRFVELIAPLRYPQAGLSAADVREIRRIKARVESERLPRGVAPKEHLKLGPGGIADVEWTAQLLQLQHGAELEGLRTTTTLGALRAAGEAGLLGGEDRTVLEQAWLTTSRVRNAITLWRGRGGDVIPSPGTDLRGVAHLLGFEGHGEELREAIRRRMRMARAVVDRVFFGEVDPTGRSDRLDSTGRA